MRRTAAEVARAAQASTCSAAAAAPNDDPPQERQRPPRHRRRRRPRRPRRGAAPPRTPPARPHVRHTVRDAGTGQRREHESAADGRQRLHEPRRSALGTGPDDLDRRPASRGGATSGRSSAAVSADGHAAGEDAHRARAARGHGRRRGRGSTARGPRDGPDGSRARRRRAPAVPRARTRRAVCRSPLVPAGRDLEPGPIARALNRPGTSRRGRRRHRGRRRGRGHRRRLRDEHDGSATTREARVDGLHRARCSSSGRGGGRTARAASIVRRRASPPPYPSRTRVGHGA